MDAGYAATTLREIASEAGVAVQTVYTVFGSKANILRSLRESVVEDPAASEAYAAALAATDPHDALREFARSIRRRWEAGHDIVSINSQAAATDPGVRVRSTLSWRVRLRLTRTARRAGRPGSAWLEAVGEAGLVELPGEPTSLLEGFTLGGA